MKLNAWEIGTYLQAERKKNGWTQAEPAEIRCVSPQAVSDWERGEALPDVSLLSDLA